MCVCVCVITRACVDRHKAMEAAGFTGNVGGETDVCVCVWLSVSSQHSQLPH